MLNYDPDGMPDVPAEIFERALGMGLHPVNVVCDEKNARIGDHSGMSFVAFGPFLPRPGDEIKLEDGKWCRVKSVRFVVAASEGLAQLVPNIYAVHLPDESDEHSG